MVFSSYFFLFYFLPAALLGYYLIPGRGKHLMLTLFSYLFYGWSNPAFVLLLLFSTVVDYICGLVISGIRPWGQEVEVALPENRRHTPAQKWAVTISILTNLSLLGFFKYFNFAVGSWDALIASWGLDSWMVDTALKVTLPLGISFYTFQSMSYTIDVYRGHARPLKNFIDFACYVSMFPQLVAGPIIRYAEVSEQLRSRSHTFAKFARGVAFLSLGLTKKIWLANPCGKIADVVFLADARTAIDAWYGVIAYAFQIYFDFSAYSDMAIGLGLMLGFVFPKNFNAPYRAISITDFWRRWHISLSSWLRDYLYIPLGGNRKGEVRTYVNLMLVMLLGGLWHGASWNFVIWGGLHGLFLASERKWHDSGFARLVPRPLQMGVTFGLVLLTWVFFRAESLPSAWAYLQSMAGVGTTHSADNLIAGLIYQPFYVGAMFIAAVVTWSGPQTWDWTRSLPGWKLVISLLLFGVSVTLLAAQAYNPFIYFIF
ncbi:MAG: MBOAT family protein [Kiritimatiellae bacterium]|nr:MBOAT family protein [Kiritimatiellia bacterium]